jgi:hypothetical protein
MKLFSETYTSLPIWTGKRQPLSLWLPSLNVHFLNGQEIGTIHNSTRSRTPVACRAQSAVAEEFRLNLIA